MLRPLVLLGLLSIIGCGSQTPQDPPQSSTSQLPAKAPTAAPSPSPQPAAAGAPEVVPGTSIGAVKIGMSRAEVEKLGLPVTPHPSGQMGDAVRMVGPFYVVFDDKGQVSSVQYDLTVSTAGLQIGGKTLGPKATAEEVAAALGDCKEEPPAEGGRTTTCAGGKALILQGTGNMPPHVEIKVLRP